MFLISCKIFAIEVWKTFVIFTELAIDIFLSSVRKKNFCKIKSRVTKGRMCYIVQERLRFWKSWQHRLRILGLSFFVPKLREKERLERKIWGKSVYIGPKYSSGPLGWVTTNLRLRSHSLLHKTIIIWEVNGLNGWSVFQFITTETRLCSVKLTKLS